MAFTFPFLVRGGPVIAKRQPNIVVPIGVAPYSIDGATTSVGAFPGGFHWPMIPSIWNATNTGGVIHGVLEAPGPTAKGRNEFAPANSSFGGFTGETPSFGRHGDIMMTLGIASNGIGFGTKSLTLSGLNFSYPASTFVCFNQKDPDAAAGGIQGNPFMGNAGFLMVDDVYIPNYPNIYFARNCSDVQGQQDMYAITRVPFNFSLKRFAQTIGSFTVTNREWDWFPAWNDSSVPRSGSQYGVRGSIPDYVNFKNHILMQNNLLGSNMQAIRTTMFSGGLLASVDPVNCDDATIGTLCANRPVQSTSFGFLFHVAGGGTLFPGEGQGHILFSPDMTKYAVVNLVGLDPISMGDIANGPVSAVTCAIDPLGIFYFVATEARIDTGFVISIPWNTINFQISPWQPSFTIPGLCGCNPTDTLGVAQDTATY